MVACPLWILADPGGTATNSTVHPVKSSNNIPRRRGEVGILLLDELIPEGGGASPHVL